MSDHRLHALVVLPEFEESVKLHTNALNSETRNAMASIKDALDNIFRVAQSVDIRAEQAAVEAKTLIGRFVDKFFDTFMV